MAERRLSSGDSWVRWILNECESSSIPYALRYFEPQKKRLLSLLQSSKIEDCELTLDLRGGRDAQGWHMHAMLTLPTGMIVSQGSEETLLGTMDRTLNELTSNLKKHLRQTTASLVTPANVRQDFLQPSHRSRIGLASAAVG